MAAGQISAEQLKYGASYRSYTDSGETHFKSQLGSHAVGDAAGDQRHRIKLLMSFEGSSIEEHFIAIADNGCGMTAEQLQQFLIYFKTKEVGRGTISACAGLTPLLSGTGPQSHPSGGRI
jgi:hypothetical protein